RADGVAADATCDVVGGDRTGQADDGGLGGAVGEAVRHALDAGGYRRHVHDAAGPTFEHAGEHRATGVEHAVHVDRERAAPAGVVGIEKGARVHEARAVEQDVDGARLRDE